MENESSVIQLLTNPAWVAVFILLSVNMMALVWGAGRLRQRVDIVVSDVALIREMQQIMGERVANLEGRMQ